MRHLKIKRESLFYLPALISLLFAMAITALSLTEWRFSDALSSTQLIYGGSVNDAQAVIRVLMGAMITLTGLVISITMLVISLSATQLGPRLIKTFMGDRRTQIYVGIFFGTVALCFAMLAILHQPTLASITPRLSISVTYLVCFLNLFVLLGYVNHVAQSGIADHVIRRLTSELNRAICHLVTPRQNQGDPSRISPEFYWTDKLAANSISLKAPKTGYIQYIDYTSITDWAQENELVVRLLRRAGAYVIKGETIAKISTDRKENELFFSYLHFGDTRTGVQDIEYSLRHLIEIGLRALSPGINDHFTAITVLEKLSSSLANLWQSQLPTYIYQGSDGQVRLIGQSITDAELTAHAFDQLRDAGQDKPDILLRLIHLLETLNSLATTAEQKQALARQCKHIQGHIAHHFVNTPSEAILTQALKEVVQ